MLIEEINFEKSRSKFLMHKNLKVFVWAGWLAGRLVV